MTTELKNFLDSLKEEDFRGSKTKRSIQSKAKTFLNSGSYEYAETYKGFDIHNSLLCLLYSEI